jgi:hypothetical protein
MYIDVHMCVCVCVCVCVSVIISFRCNIYAFLTWSWGTMVGFNFSHYCGFVSESIQLVFIERGT